MHIEAGPLRATIHADEITTTLDGTPLPPETPPSNFPAGNVPVKSPSLWLLAAFGLLVVAGLSFGGRRVQSGGMSTLTRRPPSKRKSPAPRLVRDAVSGLPVIPQRPGQRKVTTAQVRTILETPP